ncbi:MAG: N-acetylglucosamine-6-phosphate deacetylase [Muribaculaceae bacterium]|jgi:N-acetylglucosamine-6-phosphate deacetylase|nr:N-acetylglucosamine-6-phosphate deacetylase [Muribaculaceae bacterium]MBR6948311.1 N-acetylglucosamine-6-phosphate deacetylase [Muribaculaceae bacterium]
MLTQIYNGHVLTPEGWINGGSVIIEGNRIKEVSKSSRQLDGMDKTIDAHGMNVVPGGIDLHCHGGGGCDFQECTREAFETVARTHLKHGTTAIYATLSSSPIDMMERACMTCDELMRESGSTIMGMHMEGPYLNPSKAGAQMPEVIRIPDPNEYRHIVEDFDCMRRWDTAPELPGAAEMGRYITSKGIVAAIAHTAAEYRHVKAAWDAGYTLATHFYNAMPGFHNVREFKHAGTVESVYLLEDMAVEVIADGIHVPSTLLNLVYHMKGVERTALCTDALAVTDSDSEHAFDPRVIIEDGVCKLSDRSALAGSIATMDRLIKTMVRVVDVPLQDAMRMASETPARIMGIYDRKGSIQRGKDADILLLDSDINLRGVFSMGEFVKGSDRIAPAEIVER